MKKVISQFLIYFSIFLIGNLIINILFKCQANFLTAFSTAIGVSVGLAAIEVYTKKKSKAT